MSRPRSRIILATVYGLFTLNAWAQVVLSDDPLPLALLQGAIGVTGVIATRGAWIGARWAPAAAVAFGAVTATMLVALPFILGLEPEARPGIWAGAGAVLLLSAWGAWYLRRVIRRDTTTPAAAGSA